MASLTWLLISVYSQSRTTHPLSRIWVAKISRCHFIHPRVTKKSAGLYLKKKLLSSANLISCDITDELWVLGGVDLTPPSNKTALSSSLTVASPSSTRLISECLPLVKNKLSPQLNQSRITEVEKRIHIQCEWVLSKELKEKFHGDMD